MNSGQIDLTKFPIIQTEPFVVCPLCGNGTGLGIGLLDDFFDGKPLVCETCGKTSDEWRAYLATINHPNPFLYDKAAFFVGFKTVLFQVALAPGQTVQLNFAEHGVPLGSRLIRLNYTPQGQGIQPVELHGNESLVRRGRDRVVLYGRPWTAEAALADPVLISVAVTFAEPNEVNEQAEDALGRAFSALAQNEFIDMVVPATMAVEFTCKRLLADFAGTIGTSPDGIKDKDLLTEEVPKIAAAVGVPPLSSEVCERVGRLWGQRDAVAHTGRLHQPYARENAGTQLAAAVFAFRYLVMLRRLGSGADSRPHP